MVSLSTPPAHWISHILYNRAIRVSALLNHRPLVKSKNTPSGCLILRAVKAIREDRLLEVALVVEAAEVVVEEVPHLKFTGQLCSAPLINVLH